MEKARPIETRIATVFVDENRVMTITMKDCGLVDEYDVVDLNLVIRHLANEEAVLKLIIATAGFDLSKKARQMAKREDHLSKTRARAIVVSNTVKASLLNFMKQFADRTYPQRFFSNREEAHAWLLKC
jgi:hypothetical protein